MSEGRTRWDEPQPHSACSQLYTIGRLTAKYESIDDRLDHLVRLAEQSNELHAQNASRLAVLEAAAKSKKYKAVDVIKDVNTWISIGPWLLGAAYIILAKISSLPTPW